METSTAEKTSHFQRREVDPDMRRLSSMPIYFDSSWLAMVEATSTKTQSPTCSLLWLHKACCVYLIYVWLIVLCPVHIATAHTACECMPLFVCPACVAAGYALLLWAWLRSALLMHLPKFHDLMPPNNCQLESRGWQEATFSSFSKALRLNCMLEDLLGWITVKFWTILFGYNLRNINFKGESYKEV